MGEEAIEYEVVEEYHAGSEPMSLPLTFLDIHLAGPIYVRRQFFYDFPNPHNHFLQTTLPILKHTLSLALHIFFPLAGNLICPPEPNKPFIQCTQQDTVPFKIVVSSSDFDHLSSNDPKSLKDLDHLVPKLTYKSKHDDQDTIVFQLLALQVTVWKNRGVCIAITYCHVMDDRCCDHFMKTWSSLCRKIILSGKIDASLLPSPPCFDRKVLKDPRKLDDFFLGEYFNLRSTWKDKITAQPQSQSKNCGQTEETEHVKATIVLGSEDIKRMKMFALNQLKKINDKEQSKAAAAAAAPQYLSTFVVACAFVWSSLVKTKHRDNCNEEEDGNTIDEYFRFAADCTDRLAYTIPKSYFGNCIAICSATLKRMELMNDNGEEGGFVNAVRVIERAVNDMKSEPFREAENWKTSFEKMIPAGLLVTGSPKFEVYGTDFGFGRPLKVEMKHSSKVMCLAERRDDKGGVEIGLVFRNQSDYQCFMSIIEHGLETFTRF